MKTNLIVSMQLKIKLLNYTIYSLLDGNEQETPTKNKKLKKSSDQSPHHKNSQETASSQTTSPITTISTSSTGTTRTVSIPIGANPMKITLNSPTNQKSTSTSTIAKSNSSMNVSTQKVGSFSFVDLYLYL